MEDPITFARKLRREQTTAERRFWALLHPWRAHGQHWRRQAPIGPFVVDFIFKRGKLIVEIDGDSHYSDEGIARDERRTSYLERLGYRIQRFTNGDISDNLEGVVEVMRALLGEPWDSPPNKQETPT
jgi:very-short-patch-repair endonuclease